MKKIAKQRAIGKLQVYLISRKSNYVFVTY